MKKNRLNTILIVVVLGIWIVIVIRIKDTVSGDKISIATSQDISSFDNINYDLKAYKLNLSYRDPFTIEAPKIKPVISAKPIVRKEVLKFVWPEINYSGLIKSKNSSEKVALISINHRTQLAREGKVVDSLFLVSKINSDSVKVNVGKDSKWIRRKK